ncbi:MAG TPA: RidA family protein [Nitrososphaerales archaeon]|nr:RidA family protein [Nitrososphaerales archaeon]
MLTRKNFSSNGKYESIVGYSRAVKVGDFIFVSGTTGVGSEPADSYNQAKRAIENIKIALTQAGSSLEEVVRTRIFVHPNADWKGIARAHQESFGSILPANTMLVSNFLDPKILVEIEADAISGQQK